MKLYRFTALDSHRAITKLHDTLGSEALVYSTNKVRGGVEILAGIPHGTANFNAADFSEYEVKVENAAPDRKLVKSLNTQLQTMEAHIQKLTDQIQTLSSVVEDSMKKKKSVIWDKLKVNIVINWDSLNIFKNIRIKRNLKEGVYGRQTAH